MVPAVLLVAGVVGLLVADPTTRQGLIEPVVGVLPPMRDLIEVVLAEVARDAAPVSILGAVALVWGTSRFVVAFQGAIARVMGGDRRRGLLASNVMALGAVVLMIGAILLSSVLSGVLAFLEAAEATGVSPFLGDAIGIGLGLLPVLATMGAVLLPGITVGLALTILARLFAFVAPRLIGAAALLGTLATVFAALAWLALSFQALLLGAAWVKDRVERYTPPGAAPIQ